MPDLIDQVHEAFSFTERQEGDAFQMVEDNICPGFEEMREAYQTKLVIVTRRGYRQHAGSTLPTEADELVRVTGESMLASVIALVMEAFCDGVMVGHQLHPAVLSSIEAGEVGHVFHDSEEGAEFTAASLRMAAGLSGDDEVLEFFGQYVRNGVHALAHATGFAHISDVNTAKVWDLWILIGVSCTSTAYMAGHVLGNKWRENDLLDGIELASQ